MVGIPVGLDLKGLSLNPACRNYRPITNKNVRDIRILQRKNNSQVESAIVELSESFNDDVCKGRGTRLMKAQVTFDTISKQTNKLFWRRQKIILVSFFLSVNREQKIIVTNQIISTLERVKIIKCE